MALDTNCRMSRDDKDKDQDPSAGSDRGTKRKNLSKDAESSRDPKSKDSKLTSSSKGTSRSQRKSSGKSAMQKSQVIQPPQTWISNIARAENPPTSLDEIMDTPIDFSAFVMNRFKITNLTQELLVGPTFNPLKGTYKSRTKLEYHLEECFKATTERLDWHNPKGKQYPFDLCNPLLLIPNHRGQHVIPFDYLINNDLEYRKGRSLSKNYSTSVTKTKAATYEVQWIECMVHNIWSPKRQQFYGFASNMMSSKDVYSKKHIIAITSITIMKRYDYGHLDKIEVHRDDQQLCKFKEDERFDLNVALCMFTRQIVIQRRVEDLQLEDDENTTNPPPVPPTPQASHILSTIKLPILKKEGLHKGYDRFQSILSQLKIHGVGVSTKDTNQKFLRSLPSSWSQVSLIMRTKPRVDTLSFDDLYNNLKVFESDVKGSTASYLSRQNVAFVSSDSTNSTNEVSTAYGVSTSFGRNSQNEGSSSHTDDLMYTFFANQSSGLQLDHEDLEQVDEFDLEEMDLKWQVAMISTRLKKFYKKTKRKLHFDAKEPVSFDKTKVNSSNLGSDTEVTTCSKVCEESYAKLKKLYDEQREQLGVASIEIQADTLALKKVEAQSVCHQENQLAYEEKISRSSDVEDSHVNDRFVKVKGIHVVPPLMIGIYMPLKSNFGIDKSKFTYGPKQSKTSEFDAKTSDLASCEVNSSVETLESVPKPVESKPKAVSEPKVLFDAPIIEEYESDNDDEYVFKSSVEQENPSCVFINTVQHDNLHQNLKVKGIVDSGCSRYMTGNKAYLIEYQDFNGGPVAFGDIECLVLSPDFKLPDENQVLHRVPRQNNMYSFNLKNIVPSEDLACLIAKATVDESKNGTGVNKANKTAGPKEANNSTDNSQIPSLEDIYKVPNDGIFTSASYDDVGAVADFTNLESTMNEELLQSKTQQVWILVDLPFGIKALRAWYATLSTFLVQSGYIRGLIDKTLFIKKDKKDIMLVQVYVDDIIFGQAKKDGFFISHDKYVVEILKKFDFMSVKTASTPIETKKPLVKDAKAADVDVHLYRSMMGSLMYLTASRPNIMYAVCARSRLQVTSKISHLHVVKRIFRYLKGQPKLGLWYPRESAFDLEAYSYSNYARANLDRKSTTGGCQFLGRRLILWQCKKQTIVATSTTEAEYVAVASFCVQVLWIQNQMLDYGFNFINIKIYIDNESTMCIVKNLVFHFKTKHIEIRHYFIRDAYEKKLIQVLKIHTDDKVADLLTKAFDVSRFNFLVVNNEMLNL
uniref:Reverse transcriptase Ty1/copia-type domain-containing protein n=1 Tax=Tanacetum cinerariifolium TaxID=118510 RepID=A0A699GWR0_TANCI|nr:hypothetical protein [Tanacetum cinerariifolium]